MRYLVMLWNGARWERESDETFSTATLAYARAGELVDAGRLLDEVTVREASEHVSLREVVS